MLVVLIELVIGGICSGSIPILWVKSRLRKHMLLVAVGCLVLSYLRLVVEIIFLVKEAVAT